VTIKLLGQEEIKGGFTATPWATYDSIIRGRIPQVRGESAAGNVLPPPKQNEKEINMTKVLLSLALSCIAPFAWGQVSQTTTTTTTTDANGTITEFSPGSTIVLRESSGPVNYRFGKTVVYTTKSGKTLTDADVRTKIRVGVPVHVHFMGEGDARVVDRVVLDED